MEYKLLGKSDLSISSIGFGCMSLQPAQKDFESIIHAAIDKGINYFDTADLYDKGMNETLLGKAFKGKRDQVIIATKAGNQWRKDGSGWDWNPQKEYLVECAENSLKRLQTDTIDLFQLHGGTMQDDIDGVIEAFELLKQQGKIRYYGISSIRPNVTREYVKRSQIVSVMTQYSLLDRRPEESTLPLLQENNIGVVARGTVAGGLLIDKPPVAYLDHSAAEVEKAAKSIKALTSPSRGAAQAAVQYALTNEAITAAIVGIRTMEQLEDAIAAGESKPLSQEEVTGLNNSVKANVYEQNR
jgi:aryl-alcohol dehydrogenase-like predicted oxidoreductase